MRGRYDGFGLHSPSAGAVAGHAAPVERLAAREAVDSPGRSAVQPAQARRIPTVPLHGSHPPAPVDVPVNEVLLHAIEQRDAEVRDQPSLALISTASRRGEIDDCRW